MFTSIINFLGYTGATIAATNILNDQTSLNADFATGNPFYLSVDTVDTGVDIETESHPLPNMTGEKSGDFFRRGRGLTISGVIWGRNLGALDLGANSLEQIFWDTRERRLVFKPMYGGPEVYYKARVINDVSVGRQKPQEFIYRWNWTVGLRCDDPALYLYSNDTQANNWQV